MYLYRYPEAGDDGEMFNGNAGANAGNNPPTLVGPIDFGVVDEDEGGVYNNAEFVFSTACNALYAATYNEPSTFVSMDLGEPGDLPVTTSSFELSETYVYSGVIDEFGN